MDKKTQQTTETSVFARPKNSSPATLSGGAFSLATVAPTILLVILALVLGATGLLQDGYEQTDWWLYISFILCPVAFILTLFLYLYFRKVTVPVAVRSQKCHPKYFLLAIALQVGLFALAEVNGWFLTWLERFGYQSQEMLLPSTDGWGIIGVLIAVALLPAVTEELIFRGILLDGLKKNFSAVVAILLCGGIFAVYHQRPEQTIYQFCCGTAYALLAFKAGSILPTVLAHFLNNALIVILHANGITAIPTPVFIVVVSVAVVSLTGTLLYLIQFDKSKPNQQVPVDKKGFFLWSALGLIVIVVGWLTALVAGF